MANLGDHAVVIGGSIAGLITARVLSDYFSQVTILERDLIEDRPAIHKSVPQGNHLHALLQGGQQALALFYPGFTEDLRNLGAARVTMGQDVAWYLPDGKAYNPTGSLRQPCDLGFEGYCASRGLIEFAIRRSTLAIGNIRVKTGITVRELLQSEGGVRGVRCGDGRGFDAELVVDAGGRGSRAPAWLEAMGFARPEESTIGVDTAYSTANFRRPQSYAGERLIFINGPAPHYTRRGYIIQIENETLLVSLIGRFGDYPPSDAEGFLAFAKALHSPLAGQIIEQCECLAPINHHRFPTSVWRHYERMQSFPEGFLVLGDAACTFNPIYAQGMSAATLQAKALHKILAERAEQSHGLDGIASSFFPKVAELSTSPWMAAAGFDFAFPQTRGEWPPGTEERAHFLKALDQLSLEDEEVMRLVNQVFHLLRPASVLQEEPLLSRVRARMRS
jgi:2-polyprenyl-6-methoxyphenol hydroxylase-like FAD-dependent oxidoreductase